MMKALDLKIEDLLEFKPQEGKVLLRGARTLIFNADAMGTLRRDLIHNLGFERAKGFILRYGWQLGYNDGISFKENYKWDSDEELLIAGSVLFTLEGFARAENDVVKIDRKKKYLLKTGKFFNSFEAEQHIRYFGYSDIPVCWLLIGYAGGYGSAFLGEKVYYIETKCKGKGDPNCEFEGRTLAEWGDSISEELSFYEDKPIREELENAYEQIQEQNRHLERGLTVHEELNKLVIRGEGLNGITQTISGIINKDILLLDRSLKVLAFNSDLNKSIINEFQNSIIKYLMISRLGEPINNVKSENYKFKIHVSNSDYTCDILPIVAGDDVIGFVSAIYESCSEIEQESLILLQRTCNIYAMEMIRQKQIFDLENQYRADFIDTLFNQKYSNVNSFVEWGERLGQNILTPHYVLAMEIEYGKSNEMSTEDFILIRKEILHLTNQVLAAYIPSIMVVDLKEYIVILLPIESTITKDYIKKITKKVTERISYYKSTVSFGIGEIVYKIEDYYKSYKQACKALKLIKSFKKKDPLLFYDELGSLSILLDSKDNDNLIKFMDQKLKPLIDYDLNKHSDLILTLEHYLSTESIRKTAQITNLSLSGVKYRLNKIKDFGYDLLAPQERFEIQLAVKIYQIFR